MIEQRQFYSYIENAIVNSKKYSHAYLLETNNNEPDVFVRYLLKALLCGEKYKEKCNKCNKCLLIDNNEYINIKSIYPDGNYIKKEQIQELVGNYSKKSIIDDKLIYVIYNAEKMNDHAFNSLLKFLEEPVSGVIAILVTNNRYNLADTILSRCQIITLNENDSFDINEKSLNLLEILLQDDSFLSEKLILKEYMPTKSEAILCLTDIKMYLSSYLNGNKNGDLNIILKKIEINNIIKYVIIVEEMLNKLNFNVNYKLWLDEFLIKLMEVK